MVKFIAQFRNIAPSVGRAFLETQTQKFGQDKHKVQFAWAMPNRSRYS
jgi:hypothetical protein